VILEQDPLARLLVVPAATALGLRVIEAPAPGGGGPAPAVVFVPLDAEPDCRRVCATARAAGGSAAPPVVAGYGAGPPGLLAAHRAHRCADLVLRLAASAGGARFAHLPAADAVASAGLTEREADVLVLLLHGYTTPAVAERLCVSPNTARSHCRAVLRKLGAGDRRALRAGLLAGASCEPPQSLVTPGLEVCPVGAANFAETWAVAARRRAAHT
jgi:DNA-binding CsgD family transcriptional regulator